jgi:hypothetical protein
MAGSREGEVYPDEGTAHVGAFERKSVRREGDGK